MDAATGVGHVALQLFRSLRLANELYIAVQVEPSTLDAQTICEGLGANDVFRDEPLESFLRLNDSSFDVVIDCIGGKRIHEAARRILRSEGTFATLVGDELSPDSAKKAFATSLRSLRSAFKKRDNKAVHYWMPMLSETDRALTPAKKTSTN